MAPESEKPRVVSVSFVAPGTFNQLQVNLRTGDVELLLDGVPLAEKVDRAIHSVHYERPAKKKVLASLPTSRPSFSHFRFVSEFDVVFAVDTNTRQIGGDRHSVAAMAVLETRRIEYKDGIMQHLELNLNMFGALIRGKNMPDNPENWMWKVAIEEVVPARYPAYCESTRIGLVVDSNLGSIPKYNARQDPIFADYYLPPNFTLIYASADAAGEPLFSRMIRLCDREAALHLDAIQRGADSDVIFTQLTGNETLDAPRTPFLRR